MVEPSWTDYHVAYRLGSRHPLDRGAAGLANLAVDSPCEPGYVTTSGELQPGAHGIAAPVTGLSFLRASVGVVSLGDLPVDAIGERVVRAAEEIRIALT